MPRIVRVVQAGVDRVAGRARVRTSRLLVRHPSIYWVGAALAAAWVGVSVHGRVESVEATRSGWGATREVLVAVAPAAPGDTIRVERASHPVTIVPAGAVDPSVGPLVARQRIATGETVVDVDVTTRDGPLALAPDGWVVVPVVESPSSGAQIGAAVVAVHDGVEIARGLVVGSHDEATLVAVPARDAAMLAAASATGSLSLVLAG